MIDKLELQNKIYEIIAKAAIILSITCIIGNIIIGLPLIVNVKWIFFMIISSLATIYNKKEWIKFMYFVVVIALIPFGWYDSGGNINSTTPYLFLLMICITFLFQKNRRNYLIGLLLLVVINLIIVGYMHPEFSKPYDIKTQFLDRLIQIPLTLIIGYLGLSQFANAYIHDKRMLQKANEKLEFLAHRDSLTRVYNRRAFDEKLELILNKKEHLEKSIWIILFDIDHFKLINDTYGHKNGDYVICQLAETAQEVMLEECFISRWGGDEFCIISYIDEISLVSKIEEFYNKIKKIKVTDESNNEKSITISSGITNLQSNDNVLSVFQRVDKLLYQAKQQGRNRYIVSNIDLIETVYQEKNI